MVPILGDRSGTIDRVLRFLCHSHETRRCLVDPAGVCRGSNLANIILTPAINILPHLHTSKVLFSFLILNLNTLV